MLPTLAATLGVKGHRPAVGTRDCKDVLYVLGVLNLVTAAAHATAPESLRAANRKKGEARRGGCGGRSRATCGTSGGYAPRGGTRGWCW
jgi:uncharacterized membrane protein